MGNNIVLLNVGRRKFRSQTSDNMDRWKSGKGQQRERKEKQDQRRESQKKEDAGARKVEKSRITMFFSSVFSRGSTSRLAKAAGAEHLVVWELTVGVWRCRLWSGARSWGPAVPAVIWRSWLGGSAHCDLELAVEVRRCPLWSGARQLRSGSAHCDLELAVGVRQCTLR